MRRFEPKIEILLFDEEEKIMMSTTAADAAIAGLRGGDSNKTAVKVDINQLNIRE